MATILCVDDEPNTLTLLTFAFERAGFTVFTASGGDQAIEMAREYRPDLILMDLMMPAKDGYEATLELKADPAVADIPVVIFTAYEKGPLSQKALSAGAAAVLSKTTPPKILITRINDLIAQR